MSSSPYIWHNEAFDEELRDAADFYDQLFANGGTNEGMGRMMPERRLPTPPTPLELLGLAFLPREEALLLAEASGRAFAAEQAARGRAENAGDTDD